MIFCFFFQAEDGIRDLTVTGVQTCALPILVMGIEVRGRDVHAVEQAGETGRRQLRLLTQQDSGGSDAEPSYGYVLHEGDRKSTRLNSSHSQISYAVFCLKKKIQSIINNDNQ